MIALARGCLRGLALPGAVALAAFAQQARAEWVATWSAPPHPPLALE